MKKKEDGKMRGRDRRGGLHPPIGETHGSPSVAEGGPSDPNALRSLGWRVKC
ncbi:MAG: hypothetical protein WCI31_01175 [Prolixibacteraceae bacterium]